MACKMLIFDLRETEKNYFNQNNFEYFEIISESNEILFTGKVFFIKSANKKSEDMFNTLQRLIMVVALPNAMPRSN